MQTTNKFLLTLEALLLFVLLPLLLAWHPSRASVHFTMWAVAAYASFTLHRTPGFSWRAEWNGVGWSRYEFFIAAARFVVSTFGIFLLTRMVTPERLMTFPMERPGFWLVVMLLYPLLSALPQELVFRSFFFRRYATLLPQKVLMLAASALVFGFIHIVFHNPVSPVLSLVCGAYLSSSYLVHKSLRRAAIEHALYGDMVFTIGLGLYFLVSPV